MLLLYVVDSGVTVKIESEGSREVMITGLDQFGFLSVIDDKSRSFSICPDGNSFDMLHNLVIIKEHL